jgi:uncharacterized protein (DUF2252 family)
MMQRPGVVAFTAGVARTQRAAGDRSADLASRVTAEERSVEGRMARATCPRSGHAAWTPPADRPDSVSLLEEQSASRVPELVPIRHGRMATTPFSFFRGAAAVMAADLAGTPVSGIRVQLCGDAHMSNFGGFASPDRDLIFSVNDFDETLPGPWEWDVKRLAASLAVAGRQRRFGAAERRSIVTRTVCQYRQAMRDFAAQGHLDVWYARLDAADMLERWRQEATPKLVHAMEHAVEKAHTRDNYRALAKLTHEVDGEHRIVNDPPLIVPVEDLLPGESHVRLEGLFKAKLAAYQQSLPHARRHLVDGYRYVHFARKVVGVGSVGTHDWIALLFGRDGEDALVLQVKEAQRSVLEPFAGRSMFANQGQRVVEGQRLMQAASDIFLGWVRSETLDGTTRDFYVRQLWDWKMSADINQMSVASMALYGQACGWTLARAHARSGDRIAIASYLGSSGRFEAAIAEFAEAYAEQNERDHHAFVEAIGSGRIEAREGL